MVLDLSIRRSSVPTLPVTQPQNLIANRRASAPSISARARPASALHVPPSRSMQRAHSARASSAQTLRGGSFQTLRPAAVDLSDYDSFAKAIKTPSPLKASKMALSHIKQAALQQARRVPVAHLLDALEESVSRLSCSPVKRLSPMKKRLTPRQPLPLGANPSQPPPPPLAPSAAPPTLSRRGSEAGSLSAGGVFSSRKHVLELYESYVVKHELERARRERPSSREKEAAKATAKAKERPDAGSFTDVLKLYYPHFSQRTLDMMVSDAKEGIDAIDRRAFVQRAKGTYTDRLQMAFSKADKDDNGGLDVDEFVVAVRGTGAQPPGRSKSHPISERELKELFADGDSDGNGIIDLNEFLELCAHHPWLVNAFDRVVELGVRRKLKEEERRLTTIFRHPVSPLSRCVISESPSRPRYRPGLFDLRPAEEIGMALEREKRG